MDHLSWNVATALIKAMPEVLADVKAIAAYLSDGITWTRLRTLATTSRADGGLELMVPMSMQTLDFFNRSCGAVVEGRPESVFHILRFLCPRERTLRLLVPRDVEERNLGNVGKEAEAALVSVHRAARRAGVPKGGGRAAGDNDPDADFFRFSQVSKRFFFWRNLRGFRRLSVVSETLWQCCFFQPKKRGSYSLPHA